MDAGGLSQMAYNSFGANPLGGAAGFSSSRRGPHMKHLDTSAIDESYSAVPRTSRSHLLAGLRTAPKSPGPQWQYQGLSDRSVDQAGTSFPQHAFGSQSVNSAGRQPVYTLPEQVLAPPSVDVGGEAPIDDSLYAELMSTNLYLAAQQQRLQQQLINVTAAAKQFQGLSLSSSPLGQQQQQLLQLQLQLQMQQQLNSAQSLPSMSLYQQQLQQGVQPVVEPVLGHPGLYSVYNPLTGQQNYVFDNNSEEQEEEEEEFFDESPAVFPSFQVKTVSPPPLTDSTSLSATPVTGRASPLDVAPLPPPSANAFRRGGGGGHKRTDSARGGGSTIGSGRPVAQPPTPLTGTFGPGQNRAGEHPFRQPRGPPSLEDLIAKPTSKVEGSKNFAARQRRRAVNSLVRAGIERRGDVRSISSSSSSSRGSNTPSSETEFVFSSSSDGDGGSLSSKPSLGSLRAAANGAIGSERKKEHKRERRNSNSTYGSSSSLSGGDDSKMMGPPPSVAAVVAGHQKTTGQQGMERRRTPMLVLSSAEKRKTMIM